MSQSLADNTGSSVLSADPHAHAAASRSALMMGALGVVYGDIGTSALYTLRACLTGLNVYTDLQPAHLLGGCPSCSGC